MPLYPKMFSGKMALDPHPLTIKEGDYGYAENITRVSVLEGDDNIITKIQSNVLLPYTLPAGVNKVIGNFPDTLRNKIYYFVWNSNGNNIILVYSLTTETTTELLQSKTDSAGVDILAFDPSWKINHIDIFHRDNGEGDLIFWTDGLNNPMFLNVQDAAANLYGSNWLLEYITVARRMPLLSPICSYVNDATVTINNLRKKLYQLRYRYVYKDFQKSTWSPYSKLFAPVNPDSVADDIDPTKNNRIDAIINTGGIDVLKIEVAARQSLDTTMSECFLIATLNKSTLSIPSNNVYTYSFYNDGSYNNIDLAESNLLFDYVPLRAYNQVLANGNILVYGNITEGYNFEETLNVTSTVSTLANTTTSALLLTQTDVDVLQFPAMPEDPGTGGIIFTFFGEPSTAVTVSITVSSPSTTFSYTILPGDTIADIIAGLAAAISGSGYSVFTATNATNVVPANSFIIFHTTIGLPITGTFAITYGAAAIADINIACWKHKSRYAFGLVYFDVNGVTNGVVTQISTMNLLMPELSTTGGLPMTIPIINFEINHKPPIWAFSYAWVRTNSLTFDNVLTCVTQGTEKDADFGYINITSNQINTNNLPSYDFKKGDRVRIAGQWIDGASGTVNMLDFQIVDFVTDPKKTDGTNLTGQYIKIPYNGAISLFGTTQNYFIEVYTPKQSVSATEQPFFEFGENYSVLQPYTVDRSHQGMLQDQISTGGGIRPAKFAFVRGDYYIRIRKMSINAANDTYDVWLINKSVSDNYPSELTGVGRPFVIDEFAKQQTFPITLRFGQAYQQNTSVNGINRFFYENFHESTDRSSGAVKKMFLDGRDLLLFQEFNVGVVPVYTQIIKDSTGNPLSADSDKLLNRTVYPYKGKYGIGNVPESFAYNKFSKFFIDPTKKVCIRLSQNGANELSVIYECDAFFKDILGAYNSNLNNGFGEAGQPYKGNPTVYGAYDTYTNRYICFLEEIKRYDGAGVLTFSQFPKTIVYNNNNGKSEGFESFLTNYPENAGFINTLLYTFEDGKLLLQNGTTYNEFNGEQKSSYITAIFNKDSFIKKTFNAIRYQAKTAWKNTLLADYTGGQNIDAIVTSFINPQTGFQQSSNIQADEYEFEEGLWCAAFQRDINSGSDAVLARLEGDFLQGFWIKIRFVDSTNQYNYLTNLIMAYQALNKTP